MSDFTAQEIEYCLVREFAVGGDTFGPASSREHKRERMRVSILVAKKAGRAFHDSGMTYAEAYRRCYGQPLELRQSERTPLQTIQDVINGIDDEEADA